MPLINVAALLNDSPIIVKEKFVNEKLRTRYQIKRLAHNEYVIVDTDYVLFSLPELAITLPIRNRLVAWALVTILNKEWKDFLEYYSKGRKDNAYLSSL